MIKKRNPIARELRTNPLWKARRVPSKNKKPSKRDERKIEKEG